MCGRIVQYLDPHELFRAYRPPPAASIPNAVPRYNGCPTQDFLVCRNEGAGPAVAKLRWGLAPPWSGDLRGGARRINARSETVHEKPAYRSAFRRRRCVVPVNGWFEWRREDGRRQPYYVTSAAGAPISLAGLWERWEAGPEPIETFTILTTAASPALAAVHPRQPAIIETGRLEDWLDPATPPARLLAMARASSEGPFDLRPVGRRVNDVRHDDPDLLLPAESPPVQTQIRMPMPMPRRRPRFP